MLLGGTWCYLVLPGAIWCYVMLFDSDWCTGGTWWYHVIPGGTAVIWQELKTFCASSRRPEINLQLMLVATLAAHLQHAAIFLKEFLVVNPREYMSLMYSMLLHYGLIPMLISL